jgi:diadenosine tetraphosphate (Ap4A) HIT family hydrolase
MTFDDLTSFLRSRTGLQMSHVYKPVMLLEVIRRGGTATKAQIAEAFLRRDSSQIDYYRRKIVHPMPGKRLVRDGLLEKEGENYQLAGALAELTAAQREEVEEILEQRIADYLEMRNPFGDKNLDAVPGSRRFEVLKRAGNRCELCGASARVTQIDVDHIVPRAKGGSNEESNLQALCRTCNAQKKDRDDTDFRKIHDSYADRDPECVFCQSDIVDNRVVSGNELAFAMRDGYPVTEGHTLVIPRRHVADYFDLHQAERNAIERLLHGQRDALAADDPTITGWNIGVNAGTSAGQTVFHVHVHLIPRRDGDTEQPRGGVRGVIPGKQAY